MYLVHAVLRPVSPGLALPSDARELLRGEVWPEDRIEHLVVHPHPGADPVLGVYLLADRLEDAEARTDRFCHRALTALPQFAGWRAARGAAPLLAPFYERLLGL
ncbi:hypothetical protein ACFYUY_19445 [Kitasatospora sp. NPDC004745]|uniref:hypothetical protein n=1 Tax=unclassified Kitasatospora TaxID=2633591 RepID=UPI00340C7F58